MPSRNFSANSSYRYGFNGKENDKDISAGDQDYGMRIYDGRLAKFLSVDPITKKYPFLTPYQFASNRPIEGKDLDGLEFCRYDLDSYDPNVKQMAIWDGVTNFRDSKNYQIFNEARNRMSGSGGVVEGMAFALGEGVLAEFGKYAYGYYKAYRAATYLSRAESVIIKTAEKVWSMVPVKRGLEIEKAFGGNLPKAFPTIDKFVNGVAESIKSVDLGAKTYQNVDKLKSLLTKYVDDLAEFKGAKLSGTEISEKEIKDKVLTVGIEVGKGNAAQSKVFSEMVDYAKNKGVKLVTKAVE